MPGQGFPTQILLDSLGNNCHEVPSYGDAPSVAAKGGPTFYQRFLVTATQLKALKATPLVVIPAAGPGTVIVIDNVAMHYIFLTTAFTLNAGTLRLFYGLAATGLGLCADQAPGLIDQAANRTIPSVIPTGVAAQTDALGLNLPITLANIGAAEFTLGLGSLVVSIAYNILNM